MNEVHRPQIEEPATPAPLRKLPMPQELDGGFQDWRDEWVALNGEPPSPHDVWKADHLRIFELEAERDRLLTVGRLAAVLFHPLRGDASWLHTTEFNDLRAALVVANLLPGEGTDNAHLGKQPEGGS